MDQDLKALDGLVDEIVGTANFISRVFFIKGSVMAIAALTLIAGLLFIAI